MIKINKALSKTLCSDGNVRAWITIAYSIIYRCLIIIDFEDRRYHVLLPIQCMDHLECLEVDVQSPLRFGGGKAKHALVLVDFVVVTRRPKAAHMGSHRI